MNFTKYAGIEGVSKDVVKQAAKNVNQSVLQRIWSVLVRFLFDYPGAYLRRSYLGFRNVTGEINFLMILNSEPRQIYPVWLAYSCRLAKLFSIYCL